MKEKKLCLPAALLALSLMLSLPAGCGAGTPKESAPVPSPEQSRQAAPSQGAEESAAPSAPAESAGTPEPTKTPEPSPEPTATPEPTPEPTPAPTPEPPPTPAPTQSGPEDGNYTADVTLTGGSGRAGIQSPARLRCAGGQFYATLVWSSPNFDYMKVNGVRYDLISAAGENSAFEIPVAAFDTALAVIADTVAMSEPHEVEYTVTFHSASLTKQ